MSQTLSELQSVLHKFDGRADRELFQIAVRMGVFPTGTTPLTSTIMVLFFSSAGSVVPTTGIFSFLTCLRCFSVAHNPAVVIYMGKDKHESKFHLPRLTSCIIVL